MSWFSHLVSADAPSSHPLGQLPVRDVPVDTCLFRAGDLAQGFVVVLSGRIDVTLTGHSGREILLYSVAPGESCVQTTLGLMADEPYSGEARVAEAARVVLIPRGLFARMIDEDPAFRAFVLRAFGRRMADVTRLLERVAFGRIEARLAQALLDLAEGGVVHSTQAELAARIGSAREVVSRQLEAFHRHGWVETDRGSVRLTDSTALKGIAAAVL